jgi:DNA-directed RNA polymerase specialized sigma24 family protein
MTANEFNALYEQYTNDRTANETAFYCAILAHASSRLRDDDLAQDVAIRVWQGFASYKHEGKFVHWLNTIISNIKLDAVRSHAKEKLQQQTIETAPPVPLISLSNLSDSDRELANLVIEGYGVAEISRRLHIPFYTAKKRIQRIRNSDDE